MPHSDATEHFIQSLTESQNRLYGYIYSLLGDPHAATDVLQETNLVLWRKIGEFRPGGEFIPWAFGIARFQVMAYMRDRKREKEYLLKPELIEFLTSEVEEQAARFDDMRAAMQQCLSKLPAHSRELIERRYSKGQALDAICQETQRNLSAVKVALMRVRQALRECIERQMGKADAL